MKFTNETGISLSLAVWLASDEYDYNNDPNTISATTLLNPIRAIVLGIQNKDLQKVGDVAAQVPSRTGTAFHDSIEKSWLNPKLVETLKSLGYTDSVINRIVINPVQIPTDPDAIPIYMEQRESKKINGYNISGKYDFVAEGTLEDFKSTSVYAFIFGGNDKKYIQQGSIYRWLNPDIITEDHMKIQFIFTDWAASKAKYEKNYPSSKLLTRVLQLMSIQETETFISGIISKIKMYKDKPQMELPLCTDEELWRSAAVWKYYKNPKKLSRSTKNFDTEVEAYNRYSEDGSVGVVKHVPGEVKKCKYCTVRDICTQAQMYIDSGVLTI